MGQGDVRKLMVGHEMVMLYVHRKKGLIDPVHEGVRNFVCEA